MAMGTLTIRRDTREQDGWTFIGYPVDVVDRTLPEGDYTLDDDDLAGRIAIERKSGSDLYGCLATRRERFQRELERLRNYEYSAVVCECSEESLVSGTFGRMTPKSIKASVVAWQTRYPTHWIFCPTRAWAEKTAYMLLERFARDVADGKRPEQAGEVAPA